MTNSELKSLNERLQLERTYKELTKVDKSMGRKFVEELLTNEGKKIAAQYLAKYSAKGLAKIMR